MATSTAALQDTVPEWASQEARTALQGFRARYNNGSTDNLGPAPLVSEYYQTLDANQLHLLRITQASMVPLASQQAGQRMEEELQAYEEGVLSGEKGKQAGVVQHGIPLGSPLVPTEHLAFFTPRVASSTLGPDGSDTSFNPPGGVFTRRMWAGGRMEWLGGQDGAGQEQLCVGETVWERTYVEDAQLKRLGGGRGEMIVVWVRKEFGDAHGPLLVDRRSWIFQRALQDEQGGQTAKSSSSITTPSWSSTDKPPPPPSDLILPTFQRQSTANLFRYSALTFNAHAIHLSPPWAQQVEGHPNIVVHGPLNLSLMVRKWGRDVAGWHLDPQGRFVDLPHARSDARRRRLISVDYRAKRPVYADQPYWLALRQASVRPGDTQTDDMPAGQERHSVVAVHTDGQVAMEATIISSIL